MRLRLNWEKQATWLWLMVGLSILGGAWIILSRDMPQPLNSAAEPETVSLPRKGYISPDFTLQTLDGRSVTLSDLRGQVVAINFWATWCPPCRMEMPAIQQVYDRYRDQGFEVLAVNVLEQDAQVEAFAQEMDLTFPILIDPGGNVSNAYLVKSLPTTFFVDRFGVIREMIVGGPISRAVFESTIMPLLQKEGE